MAKRKRRARAQRADAPFRPASQPVTEITGSGAAQHDPVPRGDAAIAADAADAGAGPRAAPPLASRALGNALIGGFLLFQLAMPLRYYLGGRGYDERFSWRMFSSVRMQRCDARVRDVLAGGDERTVDLEHELQVAWIGMLERHRSQVVDAFLERRCEHDGVRAARYERTCTDTDGSALPRIHVALDCGSGHFERTEVAP